MDSTLRAAQITKNLNTQRFGRSMEILDHTVSTNSYLRSKAADTELSEGFVVAALTQSGGRGRRAQVFASPAGGLYFSLLLRPKLPARENAIITVLTAVAICRGIEETAGVQAAIKWINDVYIEDKKLCGILAESTVDGGTGRFGSVVLGIGVNVNSRLRDFPPALRGTVTTLRELTGNEISRSKLLAVILNHLEKLIDGLGDPLIIADAMAEYRRRSFILGREIEIISSAGNYLAKAVDIDDKGRLAVRTADENIILLNSNEVRVRTST